MAKICEYVDVCIANEEDAADVFGIKASDTDVTCGEVNREGYKEVAITLRESINANINTWSAMLYDGKNYHFSNKYKMQ